MGIVTETFPGAPGGSNLALPQHELDDTEARLIQDGLVDQPGFTRRRGPVRPVSGIATLPRKATGAVATLDPLGSDRYGVLTGTNSNGYFTAYSDTKAAVVDLTWPNALPTNPGGNEPFHYYDAKPGLKGGSFVGTSSDYLANSPAQALAFWGGGYKANYAASSVTVARGSTALTAPSGFTANVVPGMWLFANTDEPYSNTFVGQVRTVNSDTSITLASASPYAITTKAATFQSLRGIYPRVTKGRITTATDATSVQGGSTRFISQGLNSGTWNLYRQADFAFIGKVSSVASEIALTLTANAALALVDEKYIALKADGDWSITTTGNTSKPGFLNAVYAERQWYANNGGQFEKTSRVWFSDTNDPEALDVADDGDWIQVNSTAIPNEPIRGLMPAYNAMLVFKENETFAIFGASPQQFSVKKIHDDGLLSGMSVQPYGGGAIWAGREGIHFYDGIQVQNLTAPKLGTVWNNSIRTFDPNKYRMYAYIDRDHYILHIEALTPSVPIIKGNVITYPTNWVVVINLPSRAITFFTGVQHRGAVTLPASSGAHTWFLVNDSTKGVLCDSADLFDAEAADTVSGLTGPDFFFESKKFNAGDHMRLKRFKQLAFEFYVKNGLIKIDVALGLNNVATTLSGTLGNSTFTWDTLSASIATWNNLKDQFLTWDEVVGAIFKVARVRFLKRSQQLSFRLYQDGSGITQLKVGPYHIGYKLMRQGRV